MPLRDNRLGRALGRAWLVASAVAVALLLAEGAARYCNLDETALRHVVAFQGADLSVYRESIDPFLRYELIAGASGDFHGGEPKARDYTVHVNALGARGPDTAARKRPGTRRILCVGGSTMYGAGVADDETIAARIAEHMRAAWPDAIRVEALNFGRNGYNFAQAARLAHDLLDELDPDVIVVQDYNRGARLFHGGLLDGGEIAPYFDVDAEALEENALIWDGARGRSFGHVAAFRGSALYRFLVATLRGRLGNDHRMLGAQREARRLEAAAHARGAPVFYMRIPALGPQASLCPEAVDLYESDQAPDEALVHPPAGILDGWADRTARYISSSPIFASIKAGLPIEWGGCVTSVVFSQGSVEGPARVYRVDVGPRLAAATKELADSGGWPLEEVAIDAAVARLELCASPTQCAMLQLDDARRPCVGRIVGEYCLVESGAELPDALRKGLVEAITAVDGAWVELALPAAVFDDGSTAVPADSRPGPNAPRPWPAAWIAGLRLFRRTAIAVFVMLLAGVIWIVERALVQGRDQRRSASM